MIEVDKLCYQSRLRHVNAGEKFAFAICSLCFCIVSRSMWIAGIVLAVNGILTVWVGGIGRRTYVRLMMIPLAFLLLSTLAIIVNISNAPLDAYAISVGSFFITGSKESLWFGIRLISTAWASVSCLYFLSLNTTMTDIVEVLRRCHCPAIFIELMLLIYRFIFVLMESASAILISQRARLSNQNLRTSIKAFGQMGAGMFVRALQRSNALYDAMESRGYQGQIRVLSVQHPMKKAELIGILLYESLLLVLTLWEKII